MHHPTFQNSIIQCQEEYPTLWVPLRGKTRERVPQKPLHQGLQQPLLSSWVPTAFGAKESHSISQWGIQLLEPPGPHANSTPPLRCATPTALSPPHAHPSRPGVAVYPPDPVVSWTQGNPECVSRNWHHHVSCMWHQTQGCHTSHPGSTLVPTHKWRSFVTKASL